MVEITYHRKLHALTARGHAGGEKGTDLVDHSVGLGRQYKEQYAQGQNSKQRDQCDHPVDFALPRRGRLLRHKNSSS